MKLNDQDAKVELLNKLTEKSSVITFGSSDDPNFKRWKYLWGKELPTRGKLRQLLIDYGYTFVVYGLLLLTLIIILLVNPLHG